MPRTPDLPPVWLLLFLALAWVQAHNLPLPFGGAWSDLLGGLAVGAGIVLMVMAVVEMRRARTTVIPHREASALVTTGIFTRTRNPIYLGDALVLAGLSLRWESVAGLVLLPLFVWLVTDRFILSEESRLRDRFGPAFDSYAQKVRRWL